MSDVKNRGKKIYKICKVVCLETFMTFKDI